MGKMKANRKYIEADERAVSAVIGVILMVAITVAIAATVYVYVSGMIGGGSTIKATVSMIQSGAGIQITEVQNGPVLNTSARCTIISKATGANMTGKYAIINPTVSGATANIDAGDIVTVDSSVGVTGDLFTINLVFQDKIVGTCTYRVP